MLPTDPSVFASIDREVGSLQARLTQLETDMREMRADLRLIRDCLVSVKGGWRILTLVIGLSASLGALAAKLIPLATLR